MGEITLKKGTPECDIHNDLYALHLKFGKVEDSPKYWDVVVNEIGKVAKKYHKTEMQKFAECTLIAFADYLNAKAVGKQNYTAKMIAEIITCGRTKEEVAEIIKEMGVTK